MALPIQVHLLPARNGDCLLISAGPALHLLLDTGFKSTYTEFLKPLLQSLAADGQQLSHCIITHIDEDHIAGAVEGLFPDNQDADQPQVIPINQVWHNSYRHLALQTGPVAENLPPADRAILRSLVSRGAAVLASGQPRSLRPISGSQGSVLGGLLLKYHYAWNTDADRGAIVAPLTVQLAPEVRCQVLSPVAAGLRRLAGSWERELTKLGFTSQLRSGSLFDDAYEFWQLAEKTNSATITQPIAASTHASPILYRQTPFKEDTSPTNGSSIAMLLEADGRRILLLGDAHPSVILQELRRLLAAEASPWWFDCIKLSHHGSFANNSPELLQATDSDCYLFSTNGGKHHHPNPATLAWIVTRPLTRPGQLRKICCNYPTPTVQLFDRVDWQTHYHYTLSIAPDGQPLVVSL
ncbi:MBL fold metallo-hydrolase [Hymenobacter ruricola]|uniref:MBL fold metallo-hydrolase n=1 Tax=Hymenobacter ruricola TaxID=2791023 RepID=A0ABS0I358_9BACT|nr:MBL fold metallo-hydrolase [Hymenobacter ruricola]MBF9221379.1 MBL fold metallo-hydrolase [Hymenobacter ruricola]